MKNAITYILAFLTLGFASCDPIYPITITNVTSDTVIILIDKNTTYDPDGEKYLKVDTNNLEFDKYQLPPNEILTIGSAIAELDNDIKFDNILIKRGDSVEHIKGKGNIIKLFDNTLWWTKKPYNITIE